MAKYIVFGLGILLIVGLGLYMEVNNGDYLLVEKWKNRSNSNKVSKVTKVSNH